jgi:hypothetical protein
MPEKLGLDLGNRRASQGDNRFRWRIQIQLIAEVGSETYTSGTVSGHDDELRKTLRDRQNAFGHGGRGIEDVHRSLFFASNT